jgi:hypothetical protein
VAIGRAIVREPKMFLFDEPLSNLDAALRVDMRMEFARLKARLGATMIYVTHDQVEAMTLADRIVVMNAGRIEQVGAPLELYERPVNRFVAGFIGSPRMNFLDAVADEGGLVVAGRRMRMAGLPRGVRELGVRPEHLRLAREGEAWLVGAAPDDGGARERHLRACRARGRRAAAGRAPRAARRGSRRGSRSGWCPRWRICISSTARGGRSAGLRGRRSGWRSDEPSPSSRRCRSRRRVIRRSRGAGCWSPGARRGSAAALVEAFAEQGARVAFVDRDAEAGERVAAATGAAFRAVDLRDIGALGARWRISVSRTARSGCW